MPKLIRGSPLETLCLVIGEGFFFLFQNCRVKTRPDIIQVICPCMLLLLLYMNNEEGSIMAVASLTLFLHHSPNPDQCPTSQGCYFPLGKKHLAMVQFCQLSYPG